MVVVLRADETRHPLTDGSWESVQRPLARLRMAIEVAEDELPRLRRAYAQLSKRSTTLPALEPAAPRRLTGQESRVVVRREGALGILAAELATPLVMVLTELVQNALEHAFEPGSSGEVVLRAEWSAGSLEVTVSDDGRGLPADFSLARAERLGLQIVRTLVGSELRGSLDLQRGQPRGTVAVLSLPLTVRR